MAAVASEVTRIGKPHVSGSINKRTIGTLAERLFRKNLAAQYVNGDHPFMGTERDLIASSIRDLKEQLKGVIPVHLTIAGIHLRIMDDAEFLAGCEDVSDVDESTLAATIRGVEKDSLMLLDSLCLPA